MPDYITTFYPLRASKFGLNAAHSHGLSEFIDGSCRKEPDFMHSNPAISGLCRTKFSNRLKEGNRVIYWTNDKGVVGSYLVAILKVIRMRPDHDSAAEWYRERQFDRLPQNLFVDENRPVPFSQTHRRIPFKRLPTDEANIRKWDALYWSRAHRYETVAICEFIDGPFLGAPNWPLPLLISKEDKEHIFGTSPNTRNALEMKEGEWDKFMERRPYFVPFVEGE